MNDIDDQYRRASAQDPSQPSESTRRNILAKAADLARQRAAGIEPVSPDFQRPAANQPTLIGTLAAAALAGLLMTPLFLPPRAPPPADSRGMPDHGTFFTQAAPPATAPSTVPPAVAVPSRPAKRASAAPAPAHHDVPVEDPLVAGRSAANSAVRNYAAPAEPAVPAPAAPRELIRQPTPSNVAGAPQFSSALRSRIEAMQATGGAMPGTEAAAMLQGAADAGNVERLRSLLAIPIDINSRDAQGRTALMLATLQGHAGAVDVLLAHGADANAADSDGVTPLQAALAGSQPGIAAALRRAGAH